MNDVYRVYERDISRKMIRHYIRQVRRYRQAGDTHREAVNVTVLRLTLRQRHHQDT